MRSTSSCMSFSYLCKQRSFRCRCCQEKDYGLRGPGHMAASDSSMALGANFLNRLETGLIIGDNLLFESIKKPANHEMEAGQNSRMFRGRNIGQGTCARAGCACIPQHRRNSRKCKLPLCPVRGQGEMLQAKALGSVHRYEDGAVPIRRCCRSGEPGYPCDRWSPSPRVARARGLPPS